MIPTQTMTEAPQPMRIRPLTLIVILLAAAAVMAAIMLGWGQGATIRAVDPANPLPAAPSGWKS